MDDQFAKLHQIEEIRYRAFYKGIGKAGKSIFKEERDEKEKEEREMLYPRRERGLEELFRMSMLEKEQELREK